MTDYAGKTIVITGGATGIGLALARRFGAEGARIVIGEPRAHRLAEAKAGLEALGITALTCPLDVTDPASMEAFADFAWQETGAVHLLVNNAGISHVPQPVTRLPLDELRRLFDVNFFGVWHGAATFGRRMVEQGIPAAIYNVGSENSFFNAVPRLAGYIASKHAVRGLTEAMREEFPDFIRIGLICPGFVRSELTAGPLADQAMDADAFADRVIGQIRAGAFYVVTHGYNIERILPVHAEIEAAYRQRAPRQPGDEAYDVRLLIERERARRRAERADAGS